MEEFKQGVKDTLLFFKTIGKAKGSIVPAAAEVIVGAATWQFFLDSADAVYSKDTTLNPTFFKAQTQKLMGEQLSGTSFSAPLAFMGIAEIGLIYSQNKLAKDGHQMEANWLNLARVLAPIAITSVFIGREIIQTHNNPGYVDNHGSDIVASLFALAVAETVVLTNLNAHKKELIKLSLSNS